MKIIRRQSDDAIILTNVKLDSWHMYASTGSNEFVDDYHDKYFYFLTAEKYRYAWNAII